MNRAAPALIFIAPVKLRIIQLTHQYLQLHHPALLIRRQILGQTLIADEEVALRAAQEASSRGACSPSLVLACGANPNPSCALLSNRCVSPPIATTSPAPI